MAFSLKKVFKKVCALGGALMFMSPLVSPVANAGQPSASTYGKRLGTNLTAYIAGQDYSIIFDTIEVTAKTGLSYTGGPHVLFNAPIFKLGNEAIATDSAAQITKLKNDYGITPYFRVHKQGDNETTYTWVEDLTTLNGTDRGTYELFYYVDGGTTYEDSGSDTPPSQQGN